MIHVRAIVFDFDGTLIDSAPDLQGALNRLLAAEGQAALTLKQVKMMIGDGVAVLVRKGFAAAGRPLDDAEIDVKCAAFLEDYEGNGAVLTRPYPGVKETLERLRGDGLALAICTNKPTKATLEILEELALQDFFDVVVGGDAVPGARKPDPRPLLAAMERLGAGNEETVMVGDSENDMATAAAAGVPAIAVAYGYAKGNVSDLDAALIIGEFGALPAALERLP